MEAWRVLAQAKTRNNNHSWTTNRTKLWMICDLLALRPISNITKKALSYLHSTKIEQMTKAMVIFKRGAIFLCYILCDPIPPQTSVQRLAHTRNVTTRADKGWAVKRARPSKKVWCSGLGLCLELSLVFDFGQGLQCGLYIRRCRCHWIMAAWFVFLHFFLVPLCWYAVSERQMLLFFAGGLVGVDKHLFQRVSLITSMTLPLNYIFVLLLANVDVIPKQKQLSTV